MCCEGGIIVNEGEIPEVEGVIIPEEGEINVETNKNFHKLTVFACIIPLFLPFCFNKNKVIGCLAEKEFKLAE